MKRILFLLFYVKDIVTKEYLLEGKELVSALLIMNTTADIIHDTDQRISKIQYIREDNFKTAPFEVGYLSYILQEKYRKMVEKYNASFYMRTRLYTYEHILALHEIERHYWQIEHISNMLHEVERKYKIKSGLHEKYDDRKDGTKAAGFSEPMQMTTKRRRKKKKKFQMDKFWKTRFAHTTKKATHKWWDLEYGWEIDYYW